MRTATSQLPQTESVHIETHDVRLEGDVALPQAATGLVIFAHGSGSSRHSPRNRFVAQELQSAGFGTLLLDLLTREEEGIDEYTRRLRFDIDLLGERVIGAIDWASVEPSLSPMKVGLFGASTGAAAAIMAAAHRPQCVAAVVSRGGRPDLAEALGQVQAPALLIVGGEDTDVIDLNEWALRQMRCERRLEMVHGATHLFEEPGALEEVGDLACEWFLSHLAKS